MQIETTSPESVACVPVLFAIADNDSRQVFRCYLVTDPERAATPLEYVVARVIGADDEIGALAETFRAIGCPPEGRKLKVTREPDIAAGMIPAVRRNVAAVQKQVAEVRQARELRGAAERVERDGPGGIPFSPPETAPNPGPVSEPSVDKPEDPAEPVAPNPAEPVPPVNDGTAESSAV